MVFDLDVYYYYDCYLHFFFLSFPYSDSTLFDKGDETKKKNTHIQVCSRYRIKSNTTHKNEKDIMYELI